jgi:hypothetical protein
MMATKKAAKEEFGPFGERVYANAELELRLEVMVRYRTTDEFDQVTAFYEESYGNTKHAFITRSEEDGQPNFCVAVSPKATDILFSVLLVMPDPEAVKQGKNDLWILVMGRE